MNVTIPVTRGPLQNTPPSVGGGLLAIGAGVFGLVYISINLLLGKGKNVNRWKIVFGFAVSSFFVISGVMQLLAVR